MTDPDPNIENQEFRIWILPQTTDYEEKFVNFGVFKFPSGPIIFKNIEFSPFFIDNLVFVKNLTVNEFCDEKFTEVGSVLSG